MTVERTVDPGLVGADEAGGNVYDKYASTNPVERRLMGGFMKAFDELVAETGAEDVHEVEAAYQDVVSG